MSKNILIVDRGMRGAEFLAAELNAAGFSARIHDHYDHSFAMASFDGGPPDLVILSCQRVTAEELTFIRNILTKDCLLIVLSATLACEESRFVLLANPHPRTDEVPDGDSVIELVEEAFLSRYRKSNLREVHRLGSGLGLVQLYVSNIREILESNGIVNTKLDGELTNVVNDVRGVLNRSRGLEKSAVATGRAPAQTTLVSGNALLEQAGWVLPSPPSNIELKFELGENLAKVDVVVGQIMDILRNLVENAIEAIADQEGSITIRAINALSYLQIDVTDNGVGIHPEHQPKIFNMFFSTKESPGFGLWEARKAARKNRGIISFISQPGLGSTFTLRLPAIVEGTGS